MSAVRASFEDVKRVKTRKTWQLIFEVPEELYDEAIKILGGSPQSGTDRWVGIAPLKASVETPAETTTAEPEAVKDTSGWSEAKRKMVQKSGILRNEPAFHQYIKRGWRVLWEHERHRDATDEERAAYFIRTSCGVESCRDLDPDGESGSAFRRLASRYDESQRGQGDQQEAQMRDGYGG